ncbi:glycosyltransferase family 4 protein [Loktanella sp. R86503]|uniref:glycosyltransferase family 4 protein n=1 Tax=Loktanella sp. R86503 TaxID=3093847 RepID=UPI0036DA3C21
MKGAESPLQVARRRIFISAYACSPFQGSEPGVGWGFVQQLAKHFDLDVVVEEEKFKDDIERWIFENQDDPASQVNFHFIAKKRNRLLRKIWPPSYYWYYKKWHKDAMVLARDLHQVRPFDLAHQLTMVGFREPGYLWKLDIPFVWGPIGGAGLFPWRFLPVMGWRGAVRYIGYNLINSLQMRLLLRPRLAAKKASKGLIVATSENRDAARLHWDVNARILAEVGLNSLPRTAPSSRAPDEPLKIIWTGQHTHRKALNIGLYALAKLPEHVNWELHILGKGALSKRWKYQAKRLGIAQRCSFHGWIPRDEALKIAANGHVALITSLRDLTSTVTVEALELGLPVIAPSHCGFVDAVTQDCGILVPVNSFSAMTTAITQAVLTLATNEKFRYRLGQGALRRAPFYDWSRKGDELMKVYSERFAETELVKGTL